MKELPDPKMKAVNKATGEDVDLSVIEQYGLGYDPTGQTLDLTKEEKRRTTALMMAINAYQNIIIKDADYLREAHAAARQGTGPVIQPATMDAMVQAAINFDAFIAGHFSRREPNEAEPASTSLGQESLPVAE